MVFKEGILLRVDSRRSTVTVYMCIGLRNNYVFNDGSTAWSVSFGFIPSHSADGNIDSPGIWNDCWRCVWSQGTNHFRIFDFFPKFLPNSICRSLQLGVVIGPFVIAPFVVFSGFFLRLADAPKWLHWLFHASFLKYATEGATHAIFGYNRPKLECKEIFCYYRAPSQFMKMIDMHHSDYLTAFGILLAICVALRVVAFFILALRLMKRWNSIEILYPPNITKRGSLEHSETIISRVHQETAHSFLYDKK